MPEKIVTKLEQLDKCYKVEECHQKYLKKSPMTGFFRDGFCRTKNSDYRMHVVYAIITEKFLKFTQSYSNDLRTPNNLYGLPGLKPGDQWYLCALR